MILQKSLEQSAKKKSIAEFGYRIIQIEVTSRCNMGCSFCDLPIRDAKLKDVRVSAHSVIGAGSVVTSDI